MNGNLGIFSIETRRNAAIWFVPVIAAVSWWLLDTQIWTPFLWDDTNRLLQESVIPFAGPAMAGVAAWIAGRDRRRGIDELLSSTAHPETRRKLTLWAATTVWGLIAYAICALYMMGQTAFQATWAGPEFWPVAIVVLAILAHSAWGFFIGGLITSRFTAPLVAIGALGLQQLAAQHREVFSDGASSSTWVNQLAAHNGHSDQRALFYFGLAGVAIAAIALGERRDAIRVAACSLMVALAIGGGVMIWGEYPRSNQTVTIIDGVAHFEVDPVLRNNFGQVISIPDYTPPEPVCEGSPITVCTHPAYQPVLDRAISDAAFLAEPLAGLPGVPMRLDGDDTGFSGGDRNAHINISGFADRLVAADQTRQDGVLVNEAQIALRDWLLQRSGWFHLFQCESSWQPAPTNSGWPTPETCAASERFSELGTTEQHAWLETHYTDLRAGKLTLDDLP